MIEIEMTAEQECVETFQLGKITPVSIVFRGYEYDLFDYYGDDDEAWIEAMRRRDESDSTRKVLACVKRIDTGSDIEVWAVYTRERSVEA